MSLLSNSHIISEAFKRKEDDVIKVLHSLQGTRPEMLSQFFSGLSLPLNEKSVVLLHSLLTLLKTQESRSGFLQKIKNLFSML